MSITEVASPGAWTQKIELAGITAEALDGIVHDAAMAGVIAQASITEDPDEHEALFVRAEDLASQANNNGVAGQVDFLISQCNWSNDDLGVLLRALSPANKETDSLSP